MQKPTYYWAEADDGTCSARSTTPLNAVWLLLAMIEEEGESFPEEIDVYKVDKHISHFAISKWRAFYREEKNIE